MKRSKWAQWALVGGGASGVGVLTVGLGLLGSSVRPRDALADCNRQCPPSQRDTQGCCSPPPDPKPIAPKPLVPSGGGGLCPAGMARLPAGSFKMGDRGDAVSVGSFCMDKTEVTTDAYRACVQSGACGGDHLTENSADGVSFAADTRCNFGQNRGNHPMNCVSWGQSATYCAAQGKRLPTEEEWEWAARGANVGTVYPWGDTLPDVQLCWSGVAKRAGTCPVASFVGGNTPQGISDLAGNVWEWTGSRQPNDPSVRVDRGGCWWYDDPQKVRAALRFHITPEFRDAAGGFRCVK